MTDKIRMREDQKKKLLQIPGVKSITLGRDKQPDIVMTIRYNFWTRLLPGFNKRIVRKVQQVLQEK